jgi:CDP-paratose 2-epimerase
MRCLITGGCGFFGTNLAAAALARGATVTVFDNLSRNGSLRNLAWLDSQGRVTFIHGDIRNASDVEAAVQAVAPDTIFHLAGQVAMTTSITRPRADFEVNAFGALNVLEAVRLYSPGAAVIYSSTNKVYGDLAYLRYEETLTRYRCVDFPNGFSETTPLDFHSPYGCSKGCADQYMADYARMFGVRTAVFRHSSIYGGRQFATFDQGWIGWFCQVALEFLRCPARDPFTIAGDGKQVRDVLHVSDAVNCYLAAADHIQAVAGQAFNLGGGIANSLSLLELFSLLEELLGVRLRYAQTPPRSSDQRVFVADNGKATKFLGWTPQVPVREGIAATLDWLRRETRAVLAS